MGRKYLGGSHNNLSNAYDISCQQLYNNKIEMSHLKAYCLYHKEQIITNFCKDKNCLMPLCPICIRQHTQYHQDIKTKPAYFSIYEMVSEVKELVYAAITQIQQDNSKRGEILQRMEKWSHFVGQTIAKTKQTVMDWVEAQFAQMEKGILKHFSEKQEELGVYSKDKAQKWQNQLNKTLAQLYHLYENLKTEKFVGSIIIFLQQTQNRVHGLHSKFGSFQQSNTSYSPRIEIAKGFKRQLATCLSKIFKLDTIAERNLRQEERSRSPRFLGKSKMGQVDQRFERSYTPEKSTAFLRNGNGVQSSQVGSINSMGHSNRVYKQSPQRVISFSPPKNELLSPYNFSNNPRRSVYQYQR